MTENKDSQIIKEMKNAKKRMEIIDSKLSKLVATVFVTTDNRRLEEIRKQITEKECEREKIRKDLFKKFPALAKYLDVFFFDLSRHLSEEETEKIWNLMEKAGIGMFPKGIILAAKNKSIGNGIRLQMAIILDTSRNLLRFVGYTNSAGKAMGHFTS